MPSIQCDHTQKQLLRALALCVGPTITAEYFYCSTGWSMRLTTPPHTHGLFIKIDSDSVRASKIVPTSDDFYVNQTSNLELSDPELCEKLLKMIYA